MDTIGLREAVTKEDIELFWKMRDIYMREDVIPNSTFNPMSEEEISWFFSSEYKDIIMKANTREVNQLHIIFFVRSNVDIGFCLYVTYHTEDWKCFIVDYCIYKKYRNQGLGRACFQLIKTKALLNGATYFALNLSNENNKRFWESLGFIKAGVDEYGNDLYQLNP